MLYSKLIFLYLITLSKAFVIRFSKFIQSLRVNPIDSLHGFSLKDLSTLPNEEDAYSGEFTSYRLMARGNSSDIFESSSQQSLVDFDSENTVRCMVDSLALRPSSPNNHQIKNILKAVYRLSNQNRFIQIISLIRLLINPSDLSAAASVPKLTESDVNFVSMKTISVVGDAGQWKICLQLISLLEDTYPGGPDVYSYTAAITALTKNNRHQEAIHIFHRLQSKFPSPDAIAYIAYVRAAARVMSWEQIMNILDEAYAHLGTSCLEVVHTVMINLKYLAKDLPPDVTPRSSNPVHHLQPDANDDYLAEPIAESVHRAREVKKAGGYYTTDERDPTALIKIDQAMAWLNARGVPVSVKTLDIMVAVTCTHGTLADVKSVLSIFPEHDMKPSKFTFNAILARYVQDGRSSEALKVVAAMKHSGVHPDEITFNTILKIFVDDGNEAGAVEILRMMSGYQIPLDGRTKSLLIRLHGLANNTAEALRIIDAEPDASVNPHMFANAIAACGKDWRTALGLLQRAKKLHQADQAVSVAAGKCCLGVNKIHAAHLIAVNLIERYANNNMDKYTFSFILSACLLHGRDALKDLNNVLRIVKDCNPQLITDSICQRVMKNLCMLGCHEEALRLHTSVFTEQTCSLELLNGIFMHAQELVVSSVSASVSGRNSDDMENEGTVGTPSLSYKLLEQYASSTNPSKRNLIRQAHLNAVVKMLSLSNNLDLVLELLKVMNRNKLIGSQLINGKMKTGESGHSIASVNNLETGVFSLKPSTYTIAELVRIARKHKSEVLVTEALLLGLREKVYIPKSVIVDVCSFLYGEGQTEALQQVYEHLYAGCLVQHWKDRDRLVMDLHGFDRGMSLAAVKHALRELNTNGIHFGVLTIITGTSVERHQDIDPLTLTETNTDNASSSEIQSTFRISSEVQRVLIDDFLPPISSSTAPRNPGRILVRLADVNFDTL